MIRTFGKLAFALIAFAVIAQGMSGCAAIPGGDRSILVGGTSLTATVNPIDNTTMAGIETAYGAAVTAAVAYRRLPRCAPGTTASFENPCSQRSIIVTLQAADRKARVALLKARAINRSGGINAFDAIRLAREAIGEFVAILREHGVEVRA